MLCGVVTAMCLLAGCGPVHLAATTNIPTPLVVKIPVAVALYVPKEFSEYVHKEERWGTKWDVALGKAQSEGLTRLLTAMFDRVVMVDSVNAGATLGTDIRAILEPSVEEYAFVTPRDAGSPFYAVSIKYRVNVYTPDGRLADSWGFTGYGTAPAQGLSSAPPLQTATALAMRDAGAKLAVEFREQATVRGLLPEGATADTLTKAGEQPEQPAQEGSSNPAGSANPAAAGAAPATPVNTQQPIPVATGATAGQSGDKDEASQSAPAKDEPPKDEAPKDAPPPPEAPPKDPPGS